MRWYRTFLRLTPEERKFVEAYRLSARRKGRDKKPPTLERAIRMIIMDYWRSLDEPKDEQLLASVRETLRSVELEQEGAPAE